VLFRSPEAPKRAARAPATGERITDTGENLWYNRRNFTSKALGWEDVENLNETLKVKQVVKAKVWPKPDYEQLVADGMEPFFARMLKQVYDGIAVEPSAKTDEDLQRYIDVIGRVREAVFDWAKDNNANREFLNGIVARSKPIARGQQVNLTALAAAPSTDIRDVILKRVWPDSVGKRMYFREEEPGKDARIIGGNRALQAMQFTVDDAVKAMKDIEKGWPKAQEAWQRQGIQIVPSTQASVSAGGDRNQNTVYRVFTKEGWSGREISVHPTRAEAETAKANLKPFMLLDKRGRFLGAFDTEESAKEKARETVKRESAGADLRGMNIADAERQGPQRRGEGEDVSAQKLMDTFGFRGVNFGREGWINQAGRQEYLNHAYDGLHDLAEIMDVPPKALSLNGMLGIAFGAQGRGGMAAAHFVPGVNEINLTKTMGAGTLAHEWGHALDHYFATQAGLAKSANPFLSAAYKTEGEIRPEIVAAFKDVVEAMNKRLLTQAEAKAGREQRIAHAQKQMDGAISSIWRLFDEGKGGRERVDAIAERLKQGDTGNGYVRVGNMQLPQLIGELRALVKAATGRVLDKDTTNRLDSYAASLKYLLGEESAAREHEPQTTRSDYSADSHRKDRDKGGKQYWSTPWEMFARAFETYVADRLAAAKQKNTFLSDAALRAEAKDGDKYLSPYPRGEDRTRINGAIDELVNAIETKETDKGVAMFSRTAEQPGRWYFESDGGRTGNIYAPKTYYAVRDNPASINGTERRDFKSAKDARAFVEKENAAQFSRSPSYATDADGAPVLRIGQLDLVEPQRIPGVFGFDGTPYQHKVKEGERTVATVTLNWKDGKIKDLLHIRTHRNLRGQGIAERVVSGILSHNDGTPLRAVYVVPKARGFWEKMGAEFVKTEDGEDGFLTQENYDDARANREDQNGRGPDAGEGSGQAGVREGEAGQGDAGRARSGQALSRGRLTAPEVESTIAPILEKWGNAPEVVVVQSMQDDAVPAEMREQDVAQRSQGASGEPDGFFHEGKVYLVAGAMRSTEDAVRTLLHESLGHFGLRGVFGARLHGVLDEVSKAMPGRVRAKAKEYGLDFENQGERRQAAEEVLAVLAQTMPKSSLVQRAISAIRQFLRHVGFDIELTEQDIINQFILPARGFVERAGSSSVRYGQLAGAFGRDGSKAESVDALNAKLVDDTGDPSWRNAYALAKPGVARQSVADALKASFGKEVVFVRPTEKRFSTFGGASFAGRIYVNTERGQYGFVQLAGHELLHHIRADSPALYDWFAEQGRRYMLSGAEERYRDRPEMAGAEGVDILEEMLADFTGDAVADPDFLRSLAQNNPGRFRQFVDAVLAWLNNVASRLSRGGYRSSEHFSEVDELRKYLAGVLDAYSAGQGNSDIRFSRSPWIEQQPAGAQEATGNRASWSADEPGKMDAFIRVLQDKHIDSKRVLTAIRNASGVLADATDVYLQEELFHGRAAKAVHEFLDMELRPLFMDMAARGLKKKEDIAEFEKYLHARHAQEANELIAQRNPDMPDGGSGMETAEAQAYLNGLPQDRRRAFEALATRVDEINEKTRQDLIAYGLESEQTVESWRQTFENYVPLHREDMDGGTGIGQGYSVRGPAGKERTGSKRKVVDILANIAMQRERAIVRGEKNRVANALVGLAKSNPNPEFWKVDRPPMIRFLNAHGLVEERPDPMFKSRENVVVARLPNDDGTITEHAVIFNEHDERAVRMSSALKNLDANDLGEVLGLAAKVTRYLASINTQYNPIFGVVNLVRDTQGAMLNLSTTAIAGKQADVMKHTILALRGIYIDARAARHGEQPRSAWAQLWEEFQREGGQTGFRDMFRTSKDRAEAIERELIAVSEGKAKQVWRAVFDWLSDYNTAMENAVRLAAYKVATESGMTKQRAASLAKNLTVNFNRRGQVGTQAGALYAFFNASVQGTARMLETLNGPAGRKILMGGVMLGSMQALLLAAAGFDDGEPPEFVRERSLILPIGDKKYLTLPMPLGLHIIPNLGRIGTEFALSGFKKPGDRLVQLVNVFAEAFNPVGNAGLSLQTIAPSAIDPIAALAENRDWTGKPIAREDFSKLNPSPGFTRAKDTASAFSKATAKALNMLSGGTNYKPGIFSPTPDQIDYLIGQVTGGLGREAMKAEQTVTSLITGEELPTYKVPLLGRFYGDSTGQASQGNAFYTNLREINAHEAEIKGRQKAGEGVADYIRANPDAQLIRNANYVERQVGALRRQRRDLIEKGAAKEKVKAMDERITMLMRSFNERVRAVKERASG
jgi:GNAT superfamily N-acetyltransferase